MVIGTIPDSFNEEDCTISLDGTHLNSEYVNKCDRVYISTNSPLNSPLIPNSIMEEVFNKATLDNVVKNMRYKGGLDMSGFTYTDVWGEKHMLTLDRDLCKKLAITHDSYMESEDEFRSRANYIANVFDAADIEFRKDSTGVCEGYLVAYLKFAKKLIESEEQFNNRVYYVTKAFSTYMPHLDPQIPGRCQKSSGRYPWKGWEADFDIYQGINNKTGKLQTIVKWIDGEKTIVNCYKYELPLVYPVAYAYCIRRFGSNSAFKKSVKTTRIGDYIYGTLYTSGGRCTASVPTRSKKIDIYDEMAVIIAAENYGGILLFEDMCKGSFHKK